MLAIGVDIGGMSIKIGLVNGDGNILRVERVKTAPTFNEAVQDVYKAIKNILSAQNLTEKDIAGIGVGIPGTVNENGDVENTPNLGWYNLPFKKELNRLIDTDIVLSNDANVAALAEAKFGAAKGVKNCIMFTLGTGVGGGIIIDGKLYEGNDKKGAEIGHSLLVLDGERCNCGRKGCIEAYVSASALIRQTRAAMLENRDSKMWQYACGDLEKVDGKTAFECAKQGDKSAKVVQDTYIKYLGESMMNMFNIFRPEVFVLGGGVSCQGKYLTDLLEKYCEERDYGFKFSPRVKIVTANLGNDAGIIGAAALLF